MPAVPAIIGGKCYSMATASRIGESKSSLPPENPQFWRSTPLKSPNGAFFLLNEGNPQSQFAIEAEGHLAPGAKIVPLSDDAARAWGEQDLDVGVVAAAFSFVDA